MTPRGGLGKGLGALIPTEAGALQELPIEAIAPSSRQPRRRVDQESIEELAASIRQVGILQPVVVRPRASGPDERYELVLGERRWRAAQRAGLASVPALIVATDDRGALQRALIENLHRRDLNPLEEAAGYRQMLDEGGLTHEALAEQLGLSRPAISNALRLLDLPPLVGRLLAEGQLTAGHARALLGLDDPGAIERLAARVLAEGLTVRQTEALVRAEEPGGARQDGGAGGDPPLGGGSRMQAAGLMELSERLSEDLQTRVTVFMGRRKGRIVIEFGSVGDLERIYRRIAGG